MHGVGGAVHDYHELAHNYRLFAPCTMELFEWLYQEREASFRNRDIVEEADPPDEIDRLF